MRKTLAFLTMCLLFLFALFPMVACGDKDEDGTEVYDDTRNENLWHGYKIYDGSTLNLKEKGIEYTLEFYPEDGTYLRRLTQSGQTTEIFGSYIDNGGGVIYMYLQSGSPWGIFMIEGEEATVTSISSLYMEYFTRD